MPYVYAFDHDHGRAPRELVDLLGGKGANLAEMTSVLGLPVPPGFTITTAACRVHLGEGWPEELDAELAGAVERLEQATGRRLGAGSDPLLVSVRSGARSSMPGMLDTVLNLGLNDESVEALATATGDAGFAHESYRRLVSTYTDIVGTAFPQEPAVQLREAVEAVFRSWGGPRAVTYREREGIPHDLGTAVNVQVMVFGNRDDRSGTGVAFTRNASTGEPVPYGDFLLRAQGEDVVAGVRNTDDLDALARAFPVVHAELLGILERLEQHYRDMCDTEFTIEQERLWMLQTRVGKRTGAAALRMAVDMATQPGWHITRAEAVQRITADHVDQVLQATFASGSAQVLTTGLPASPGAAVGRVHFTPEACVDAVDRGEFVILVRNETSPEDVHGMQVAEGILTSRGGLVSHAAVVARGWGIPAVVGAEAVQIGADHFVVGEVTVREGDVISLDGATGEVVLGERSLGGAEPPPELATILAWADEISGQGGDGEPIARLAAAHAILGA